jgi:CBS domain containing-hemolysin-like protein
MGWTFEVQVMAGRRIDKVKAIKLNTKIDMS